MWTFLVILVMGLVNPVRGKVLQNAESAYSVRASDSCPRLGYFLERVVPPNALGSQGICLLCFCKDEDTALCWKRDSRRCGKNLDGARRSKRVRRGASFLSSLLQPTIQNRNQKKYRSESCTPFKGSYSEGCPPDDWCTGCTVCDCNAEGRWDCHLLSFCGDKNKKQREVLKKVKPSNRLNSSYMKSLVKAAQRKTTKKPKVVKRKAGKPATKPATKKPAFKPKPKPKLKPKPKRSITQQSSPEARPDFNDSILAQEVVKRVMAAIQGMAHKKYGLRPELRGIQSTSTKKPTLRYKKVTKKQTKPTKPTKPIRRPTTPKPKSKPKPKSQPQKATTKKQQTKKPMTRNATKVKSKSVYEKKLEEELQKVIAKAASKIYRKRHKRDAFEYVEHSVSKNPATANTTGIVYDSTVRTEVTPNDTFLKSENATYVPKIYKLQNRDHKTHYEYSALNNKNNDVPRKGKEEYYIYFTSNVTEKLNITTSTVSDHSTPSEKNIHIEDVKIIDHNENSVNESKNDSVSTFSINDQIDPPNIFSNPTEKYSSNLEKNVAIPSLVTDNSIFLNTKTNTSSLRIAFETRQRLADYDDKNITESTNISMVEVSKALDLKKDMSTKAESDTVNKPTDVIQRNKTNSNFNMSTSQNLRLRSMMKKKIYTKTSATNDSNKNYFRRLFRYILTKTKRERRIMRKKLLEQEKFNKLEIIRTLCQNIGSCHMTRSKTYLIKPLLQELSRETNKIFKTIKIIKGLIYLLDMQLVNGNSEIEDGDRLELDTAKLNSIIRGSYVKKVSGKLTHTELTQINLIKNNTDIFILSVGNFASILYELLNILTSNITKKSKHRQTRADVYSEKGKVQSVFKRIKDVLKEHDLAEKILIDTLYQNITKKDRNDVLHLIYKNSDIMDNYKYRVLEILSRLKGILNKIEMIRAERREKAKLEAEEKLIAEKTKAVERQKLLEKEAKKKQQIDAQRKEMEGIPVWNRGKPNKRRKRQLGEDRVCEYLLVIMEFLLKHTSSAAAVPPVEDGIELLISAIQNAPDIERMPTTPPTAYHAPNKTDALKEFIQKLNDISSERLKSKVKIPPAETNDDRRDHVNVKNIETERPVNLNDVETRNLGEVKHKVKKPTEIEEDALAMPHYLATNEDDEYDHRYERQLGATKLKKANEKLEQYSEHNRNLEKVMEKMVYNQVGFGIGNKSREVKTGQAKTQEVDVDSSEVFPRNAKIDSNNDVLNITTTVMTTDDPNPSTTATENYSEEIDTSKIKSSHKVRHTKAEEYQHESKPKLVWIAATERIKNIPQTTPEIIENTNVTASTVISTPITTPNFVTEIAIDTTTVNSKKIKRNSTVLTTEDVQKKEVELLHSGQTSSERYSTTSGEESDEEY